MMKKMEPMMKSMGQDKIAELKTKMEESKKKMKEQLIFTKDGKMKFVMKMLMEKPDAGKGLGQMNQFMKPLEIIKKMGDQPPVKLSQEQIEAFGKPERTTRQKDTTKMDTGVMKSEMNTGQIMGEERAIRASQIADTMDQAAGIAKAVAKIPGAMAVPGLNMAVGAIGVASEATAIISDIANMSIKVKSEFQAKGETEQETESTTRLLKRQTNPIGIEEVKVADGSSVKALHMQTTELREFETRTKITKMNMDIKAKTEVSMEVEGGAKSTTGKVMKMAGKLSDPFGAKKKKQEQMQQSMADGISKGTSDAVSGMEFGGKMQHEQVQDVWISPSLPALGMAKLSVTSQDKETQTSVNAAEGSSNMSQQAAAYGQYSAQMGSQMSNKMEKPKSTMIMTIEAMGDSGAKSEL